MLQKIARVLAAIYLAYLGLSILVVLPALNFFVPRIAQENLGRPLRAEIILYNPFAFSVEARRVQLPERDGSAFASLRLAEVNLSLASLWHQGWVFDALTVKEFKIHIERTPSGDFNFSDMLSNTQEPESNTQSSTELPGITVREFLFDAQYISIDDNAREVPFSTHYEGLAIKVNDLSTIIEEGKPYKVSAQAEAGGRLEWEGTVSVPTSQSRGKLSLSNISLETISRFAEPWISFKFNSGRLEVKGNYDINWADELTYRVSDAGLKVTDVEAFPKDVVAVPDTSVTLASINLGEVIIDSASSHINAGDFVVDGLVVSGWSEAGRVSLQEMFAPLEPAIATSEPEQAAESSIEDEPTSPWTADLRSIQLHSNELQFRSEFTDPPQLSVAPIDAHLNAISWPLEGDSPLSLELAVNDVTQVMIDGSVALATGQGALNYRMNDLLLKWFNPNLPAALKATISDGKIEVQGKLDLNEFIPSRIQMNGAITDFSGKIQEAEAALTSWKAVRWDNLDVDLDNRSVGMNRLTIHDYAGRIHIAKDGSLNAQNVWQEELGESAEDLAENLELDEPWKVNISEIFITQSAVDFMDESLPIPFRTIIGDLNGEVLNLSSATDTTAAVDIKGTVDGYAPVALIGTANPFLELPALDLGLTFNGVDMALLSPYSGTYAGRVIERGLLNLDLKYSLQENKLDGGNKVLIKQLKLGDSVESDKSLDLPLDLALALLTDMNGVIDLSVPVSGDMDNPAFSIGSVISTAFINLITKAITAPFSLLASLVGSEDDLQRIAFPKGSSELQEATVLKLTQLGEALTQRPGLTLIVTGRLNIASDRVQLQTAALHAQLLEKGLNEDDISTRSPQYLETVESRYQKITGDSSDETPLKQQFEQVLETFAVSDSALQQLAEDRAVAVKQYLVNELGIASERAAIAQGNLDPEDNQFGGVELGLES